MRTIWFTMLVALLIAVPIPKVEQGRIAPIQSWERRFSPGKPYRLPHTTHWAMEDIETEDKEWRG